MRRVAVSGLFHESNTFVPAATSLADFTVRRGEQLVEELSGTQTVSGGFLAGAHRPVPVLHAFATPAGVVEAAAYEKLVEELCRGLADALPLDGVLLELHGAMVVEGLGAADGHTAARVREAIGRTPLAIVIDPHTNLSAGLAEVADILLAYRTNPHVDMAETGERAAALLSRILDGELDPVTVALRVPVTAPAIAQVTAEEPLLGIIQRALAHERKGSCLAASVLFGFAYADVPEQSMAIVAMADRDAAAARAVAADLAGLVWHRRGRFQRRLLTPAEAVEIAAGSAGLTALANIGDNVGGGAPGDSTAIASALAGSGLAAATTVCDAVAVAVCDRAGEGARVSLSAGTPGMELRGTVRRLHDGRYVNDGPLSRGVEFDMGRVAVVEVGSGLTVVLQSRAVMANDQNMLRSCGIDLDALAAVDLKGAAAIRAGWQSRAARFLDVDTPGPTAADLWSLDLRYVRRPLWPLDEFEWEPEHEPVSPTI